MRLAVRAAVALALAALALGASSLRDGGRGSGAVAAAAQGSALAFQPVLGLPVRDATLIGAAPGEDGGEIWGAGALGRVPASAGGAAAAGEPVLLRARAGEDGWQVVPVADAHGVAIPFQWSASAVSAGGGVALLGSDPAQVADPAQQRLALRDPGGAFALSRPAVASGPGAVLAGGEQLATGAGGAPAPLVALDAGGHAGALVAPVGGGVADAQANLPSCAAPAGAGGGASVGPAVLRSGGAWTREPLCVAQSGGGFADPPSGTSAVAIGASSAQNAWVLATAPGQPGTLYQRAPQPGGAVVWVARRPATWVLGAGPSPTGGAVTVRATLTVTAQGVWVDAILGGAGDVSVLVSASAPEDPAHGVLGTWCYPQVVCGAGAGSLGAPLPSGRYDSAAWPGAGPGDPGARIVAGLPGGALLRVQGAGDFARIAGAGGAAAASAAFVSPQEGWETTGGEQAIHVTGAPAASALTSWPVPFRRPLLAIATEPGKAPGFAGARALAVGDQGEVARYVPGQGWAPEFLLGASGTRATPRLRGVAWPEPGRAYAVGDGGAMWVWQAATGLWEPDPGAPYDFHANLTAIAFAPGRATLGYAVGKQGVLLRYDKTWRAQSPPAGLEQAHFTSVAFAGGEALAAYRMPDPASPAGGEVGGAIVNDGSSGWRVDAGVAGLLASLAGAPAWERDARVISRVAGLPDGGAVAAGPHVVLERDGPGAPWRFASAPLPAAANVDALAAVRGGGGGPVRALVSVDTSPDSAPSSPIVRAIDVPPAAPAGGLPVLIDPDPLPVSGHLLLETADGWSDVQRDDFPQGVAGPGDALDLPGWTDPVLALAVDPSGASGWAVGGQTGGLVAKSPLRNAVAPAQTAAVERVGAGPAPPASAGAPIATAASGVTFAVGGNAQCAQACADLANTGIGPDAWLSSAIARAGQVGGLRAFVYTGSRLASGVVGLGRDAALRELGRYGALLRSAATVPTYAAASATDLVSGTTGAFATALGGAVPAGSVPAGTPAPPLGSAAYAFDSSGAGGTVRAIMLDYARPTLGASSAGIGTCPAGAPASQLDWLCQQLDAARAGGIPALVVGNRDVTGADANAANDGAAVSRVLVGHGASAYLFDSPERNVWRVLGTGSMRIPAYGSGTLGYTGIPPVASDFLGASGFLLASVEVARRDPATNVAPVRATLVPNIGQLGLDATNGLLLRRSQVALFQGLARRPRGGGRLAPLAQAQDPDPYVPIPQTCLGDDCDQFIPPQYTFSSSNPDIGDFVARDPNSTNPRAVLEGKNGKPIPDPTSGTFCAFNAGTTTVTLQAGGLSYSAQVTVQGGSVLQPCGTVPLKNPPAPPGEGDTAQIDQPGLGGQSPGATPPLTLVPPQPPAPVPHPPAPVLPAFFVPLAASSAGLAPGLPPPPPPATGQPTPPSGTGQVGVFEEEREESPATEMVSHMAAYHPAEHGTPPWSPLLLVLIAAGAGIALRGAAGNRGRTGARDPAYARLDASPVVRARRRR